MNHLKHQGARLGRARVLYSLGFAIFATVVSAACGDDSDDDADDSGGLTGGTTGTSGGSSSGGSSSGGSISIGSGGDNGSSGGTTGSCGASPFEAAPTPVNILLVIDKSASTDTAIDADNTRWEALQLAVGAAVDGSKESISYGLALYPETGCDAPTALAVDVGAGVDTAQPIVDAMAAVTPSGGTPTADTLQLAFDYFDSGDGAALEGERYVLLATDGGPNCNTDSAFSCMAATCTLNMEHAQDASVYPACTTSFNCCDGDSPQCLDDTRTTDAIAALAGIGVKTIVVGIPGTEAYGDVLDAMAEAGGATNPDAPPSYYAVEAGSASGLSQVLTTITSGLIHECDFQLASEPPDWRKLQVFIDDVEVPYDADMTGAEGFTVDLDTSPPTVVLVGETCDTVKAEGAESVQVLYGCGDIPK